MSTLVHLDAGARGVVLSLSASGLVRRRLLDLGLVPGTEVAMIRRSPLGDPAAFLIRGAMIALRDEDAALVAIDPLSTGTEREGRRRCQHE